MDEKAFGAAMDAYERTPGIATVRAALKAAITAYEQARERVAVPTRSELADELSQAFVDTGPAEDWACVADRALELLSQRPAPSAQPESVIINGVSMPYSEAMRRVHESHKDACLRYAEQIRNLEKRAKRAEDQAGKARCERDEALEQAASARPRMHSEACDEHLLQLERELAAERAAHEADKQAAGDFQRATGCGDAGTAGALIKVLQRDAEAAEKRAAELERERDEARAKLEGETSKRIDTEQHLAASSRKQQRTSMALAVARTELREARGALSELADHFDHMGKRDPAPALHSTPWEYCARYCREARIQSTLAQESAKPAEPKPATFGERIEHFARESVKTPENGAVTSRAAKPKPGNTVTAQRGGGLRLPDAHLYDGSEPELFDPPDDDEPKPGDVLSGDPFQDSLAHLINACGFESTFGDMPDHIASRLLVEIGRIVGSAIRQRDAWMGRKPWAPGDVSPEPAEPPRHNAFGDSHTDFFAQQEMLAQKALAKHPGGIEKPAETKPDDAREIAKIRDALRERGKQLEAASKRDLEAAGVVLGPVKALEGGGSNG